MKILAVMLFSIAFPNMRVTPPLHPAQPAKTQSARKGGVWYFAENGHAVYCYGPVMYVRDAQGSLTRVATFCRGDKTMVPLKD